MAFIYQIKNNINNKVYIGSTNNFKRRKNTHIYKLENNQHDNYHLQNSWNKYGCSNFEFSIICECDDLNQFRVEQEYIDKYICDWDKCYNISIYANGGSSHFDIDTIRCIKSMLKYGFSITDILKETNKSHEYISGIKKLNSFKDIYSEYNIYLNNYNKIKCIENNCIIRFGVCLDKLININDKTAEIINFIEDCNKVLYIDGVSYYKESENGSDLDGYI